MTAAWRGVPGHLVVLAWPAALGSRCDLTGAVEARPPGPHVVRFCEPGELTRARELMLDAIGDYEASAVYRYDGEGYARVLDDEAGP